MNPFIDNIPLVVFTSMALGFFFGWRIGLLDGTQREQKAQAARNRIQRELRSRERNQRHEEWEKQNLKVK